MPTKKTTTASAPKSPPVSKKPIAKKEVQAVSHDHSALESDINSLKKEVASLKLALAESIVAHKESDSQLAATLELLISKVDKNDSSELKDVRYDELIKDIKRFHEYRDLRKLYRSNK